MEVQPADLSVFSSPWKLVPNQVRACGGREIHRFRGITPAVDTPSGAEAWVGSTTPANGVTKENPYMGCAQVDLPTGERRYLFQVIQENPKASLGPDHLARYGTNLGMLVKLLDAKTPFLLQCHPTREVAARDWNSNFGKEECWYILRVREDAEEEPYILLGFREGITREAFEKAYRAGDLPALEGMCHKIKAVPGDSYVIPGGVPHALGAGCLVVEIQEPSDLTAVPIPQADLIAFRRKANPKGVFIPEDEELYEKRMLGAFHYEGTPVESLIDRLKSKGLPLRTEDGGQELEIFGTNHTSCFSCTKVQVHGTFQKRHTADAQIGLVIGGEGEILCGGSVLPVRQGDELFFPYEASEVSFRGTFTIILCNPGITGQYKG